MRRLASYGGKNKTLEVFFLLVGAECPGRHFASLSLPEVCCDDVWLRLGLLWTWESVEDVCVIFTLMHVSYLDITAKPVNFIAKTFSEQGSALIFNIALLQNNVLPYYP